VCCPCDAVDAGELANAGEGKLADAGEGELATACVGKLAKSGKLANAGEACSGNTGPHEVSGTRAGFVTKAMSCLCNGTSRFWKAGVIGSCANLASTRDPMGLVLVISGEAGWNFRRYFLLRLVTRPVPSIFNV